MKVLVGLTILALGGGLTASAQSPKKPWEWSVDDRIAVRTSTEAARQRMQGYAQEPKVVAANAKAARVVDSFDGQMHPELFLPHEVFGQLVKLSILSNVRTAEVVREGLAPDVKRYGLPEDFFERLTAISAVYAADTRAMRSTQLKAEANQVTQDVVNDQYRALCRSRAEALAAARAEFGRQRFDRFLYETVAVHMFSTAFSMPDPALLRQAEEGCR